MSPALAESLALPRRGEDQATALVDSISIPGLRLEGIRATLLRTAQPGVDGLLGLPAFENLLLTIDYPAHALTVSRDSLPAVDGREVLPIERVGSLWGTSMTAAGHPFVAVIDTRSTGAINFTPADTSHLKWSGPLVVIGQARGAAVPMATVLGGRLAGDVALGRHVIAAPFVSVHALPADFPQNPILGARLRRAL